MNYKLLSVFLFLALLLMTCKQLEEITPTRVRSLDAREVSSYHTPMSLQIGWFPYQEHTFKQTGRNEWRVVKSKDTDKKGAVPMILVQSAGASDSLWIDMNIDNALLGKLVKHSIMTQEPIFRPFVDYFEVAKCSKCHPEGVDKGF